ncbi:MAG: hypothetical protein V1822_03365 [Candidatus Micrarchaeota archaeon]
MALKSSVRSIRHGRTRKSRFLHENPIPSPELRLPSKPEYMRLLETDIRELAASNPEEKIREFFEKIENAQEKKTAFAILELSKKLYPKSKLRHDGLSLFDHLITIAYWAQQAGAGRDDVLAALLHDSKEDGFLSGQREFEHRLGPGCSKELINSVWTKVSYMTNVRPLGQQAHKANEFITAHLLIPEDLENPEKIAGLKGALDVVIADYSQYMRKVYHSQDYGVILLKELDALHNIRSAFYLEPGNKDDFAKIIKILYKLETHIDASKKVCHEIARMQLISAWAVWEKLKESQIDLGGNFFKSFYANLWSHTFSISENQRRVERKGVGGTDPRPKLNIDTVPYRRTVPVIFYPEFRNWWGALSQNGKENRIELVVPRHCFPQMKMGVFSYMLSEFGLGFEKKIPVRNFINSEFLELNEQIVVRKMKSAFARKHVEIERVESALWPVFQKDVFVFWVKIPQKLAIKTERISAENGSIRTQNGEGPGERISGINIHVKLAQNLQTKSNEIPEHELAEDYARLVHKITWAARKAFYSALKDAKRMRNYGETIL